MSKTFLKPKTNDRFKGVFPFEFADKKDNSQAIPESIHMIPIGQWEHDLYGPILINKQDIKEFAQNFNANIRKGVYITAGHEGFDELPAQGWVTDVEVRDDGLWGKVAWNDLGKATLSDRQYKFFSPEFYRDYEDPQSHAIYRNVLIGGALTKSPYFKELQAIVFSEKKLQKQFNDNNKNMNLAELLAKDITTLTDEEKAFIKEHASELTEEQKTSHTAIIDVETAEEKTAREEKEKADKEAADKTAADEKAAADAKAIEDANVAAGLNPDGSAKQEMSDKKILMSEAEVKALQAKADQGAQAFKELEATKLKGAVAALTFSETNKAGKFLPKSSDNLRAFMETLNDTQRVKFAALLSELPKTEIFDEKGAGAGATEGTAQAELDTKVAAKQKENSKLTYSEALKEVFAENKGLEQRYNDELPSAKKVQA